MTEEKLTPVVETEKVVETTSPEKVDEIVKDKAEDVTFDESQNNKVEPKETEKELSQKEQNRINALKRIEEKEKKLKAEEARRKELEKARKDGIIEGLGSINPFTATKIETDADFKLYQIQKEMKEKGLEYADVVEFNRYVAEKEANERKTAAEEQAREVEAKEKFDKDFTEFTTKHPDIDLEKLNADPLFKELLQAKYLQGGTITQAYETFENLYLSKFEKEKTAFILKERAREKATEVVTDTSESTESEFYTEAQLKKMSVKEVQANMDKVNRSYAKLYSSK